MALYELNKQESGQWLQKEKTLPEIVAERPEAVISSQQQEQEAGQ